MSAPDGSTLRDLFGLHGRTGIVTGGSRGLGLAICGLLAEAGARVYALSRTGRAQEAAVGAAREVVHVQADIADEEALGAAVRAIGEQHGLDFLVNNAGRSARQPLAEVSAETWDAIHDVNLRAAYLACRYVYPYLKRSDLPGRVVFITSMGAHLGFNGVTPYCASKAGLLGLMRGLAVEWAADGILVNSVAPGWFASDLTREFMDEERRAQIVARMPLHRLGSLREVAAAVLFLLGPAATYITGHDLAVDGGTLAFGY